MTDLLIEEPGPMEEGLDDRQETSLIEIMVCCIRQVKMIVMLIVIMMIVIINICFIWQSATGEPPVGRGPTRRVLSGRELKQVADDKTNLTSHFITTLPQVFAVYRGFTIR